MPFPAPLLIGRSLVDLSLKSAQIKGPPQSQLDLMCNFPLLEEMCVALSQCTCVGLILVLAI